MRMESTLTGASNTGRVVKKGGFRPISHYMPETVPDRDIDTLQGTLSNDAISVDRE